MHNQTYTTERRTLSIFLNSDGDTAPYQELRKRRITTDTTQNMEGLLTLEELTKCLFNHMKGGSSPGIDGVYYNY